MKHKRRAIYGIEGDTFGERLLDAIEKTGHTRSDLAKDIRKSWNHVHLWCTDKVLPKADSLEDIGKALGVSLNELLGIYRGYTPIHSSWAEFLATAEGASMTELEELMLAHVYWPAELGEPSVFSYQLALQSMRAMKNPPEPPGQ